MSIVDAWVLEGCSAAVGRNRPWLDQADRIARSGGTGGARAGQGRPMEPGRDAPTRELATVVRRADCGKAGAPAVGLRRPATSEWCRTATDQRHQHLRREYRPDARDGDRADLLIGQLQL